jgi:hypothetical protein
MQMVRLLVAAGANLEASARLESSVEGSMQTSVLTPLAKAAQGGQFEIMQILLGTLTHAVISCSDVCVRLVQQHSNPATQQALHTCNVTCILFEGVPQHRLCNNRIVVLDQLSVLQPALAPLLSTLPRILSRCH